MVKAVVLGAAGIYLLSVIFIVGLTPVLFRRYRPTFGPSLEGKPPCH